MKKKEKIIDHLTTMIDQAKTPQAEMALLEARHWIHVNIKPATCQMCGGKITKKENDDWPAMCMQCAAGYDHAPEKTELIKKTDW